MKYLNIILILWGLAGAWIPFLQINEIFGVYAIAWAILLLVVFFAIVGVAGTERAFGELFVYAIIFAVVSFLGVNYFSLVGNGILYFGGAGVMLVSTILAMINQQSENY
jgi:hypothetical protein